MAGYGDPVAPTIDLAGYFARIGYTGPTDPTLSLLRELCSRHLTAIPFECLDPFLGHAVELDPAALQAKLVGSRRGGYCHEHNALSHGVLATLGFSVTALGGRVVGTYRDRPAPLTHRLTLVHLDDDRLIADVGAGGRTPPVPLRIEPGLEQVTSHGTYRLGRAGEAYELQLRVLDRWEAIYRFDLAPAGRHRFRSGELVHVNPPAFAVYPEFDRVPACRRAAAQFAEQDPYNSRARRASAAATAFRCACSRDPVGRRYGDRRAGARGSDLGKAACLAFDGPWQRPQRVPEKDCRGK